MFGSKLDERGGDFSRRRKVRAAGPGGLALLSQITGLARSMISRC
jgi:hypothetical protein